jgi:hypothetical protein
MTGYVRNDTTNNIATGNVINASDLDGEFDAVVSAFHASTGHTHDGTAAEGAPITKVGPSQAMEVTASALVPKTDNTLDLGTASFEFKDLYIDGTANIDSLVADTADINGGTIDGVTITTPRITTGLWDTNGNEIVLFTATASAVNEITVTNRATGGAPSIAATGTDTNISLNLVSKGTGTVQVNGAAALFSGGALGTPSSGTLTNATGLPISTGVSGLGTGIATWLATPSSANLAAAVTDETGSGALVFATSPTLVTPVIGAATGTSLALTGGSLTTRPAATQDGVVIAGRAGGTSTYNVTITPTTLSASRTLTLANGNTTLQAGTMAVTGTGLGQFASTTSLQLAGVISDETGSGSLVFATSPTLVTPILGTPQSATLTNATGLPIDGGTVNTLPVNRGGTGITSFGAGVATWLGTPSSANLAAAVTDETGSGALVFAASPTFSGTVTTAAVAMADNLLTRSVLKDYAIEGSAVGNTGATETLDLENANFFSATLDQACTFTFSNPPASGDFGTFVLELTDGGAFAITWPASVDWPGGVAPTLTASGKDQLVFTTRDAGTTWFGFVAGKDIK